MALSASLSNFAANMPRRPSVAPVGGRTRQQPTTRPVVGPRIISSTPQATTRPGHPVPARPAAAHPAAAPAAAAPLAGFIAGTTPLPPDATYEQQVAAAARNRDMALSALGQQRTQGLQQYGYTEVAPGQIQFDPNNPFSQAALLKKHRDQAQKGNVTGMAARGQLYSGALQNAQDYTQNQYLQSDDALTRAVVQFLSRNTQGSAQAAQDYESQVSAYGADRLGRVMSNPLYDPAALAANAPAAAAPAGPTKASAAVGRPTKTVHGQRFYQRASDGKWIPF